MTPSPTYPGYYNIIVHDDAKVVLKIFYHPETNTIEEFSDGPGHYGRKHDFNDETIEFLKGLLK
jgi:hypothetical protein